MRSLILASAIMLPVAAGAAADRPIAPDAVQISAAAQSAAAEAASQGNGFAGIQEARVFDPIPADCPTLAERAAEKRGRPLSPEKLTDLPRGEAFHAVYRLDSNGCPDPVLVGYQHQGNR